MNIGGVSPLGPLTNETVTNHGPIGSVSTDFIKSLGRHTLNFGFMGVELEDDQANYFQSTLDSGGHLHQRARPQQSHRVLDR